MSEQKKLEIIDLAKSLLKSGDFADLHELRKEIQYRRYWDSVNPPEYYTNDEIYNLCQIAAQE